MIPLCQVRKQSHVLGIKRWILGVHKSAGCPIVPVVSWHPEGGALLGTPRGQEEGAFILQEHEEEAGAGQGEVYGHSSGAPAVCLTPSGLPTWSCGAVFIAFSPWEQ